MHKKKYLQDELLATVQMLSFKQTLQANMSSSKQWDVVLSSGQQELNVLKRLLTLFTPTQNVPKSLENNTTADTKGE